MTTLPARTQRYEGPITNTDRWNAFEKRPGDIFVCTTPKSGTTWTQAICAMLIFGGPDIEVEPANISPWFDAQFLPLEDNLALLAGQNHRRYIKTHTPLDGIPYFKDCTYLVVHRDPRDIFFSMLNHVDNMTADIFEGRLPGEPREAFMQFLTAAYEQGRSEQFALNALTHHLESFWPFRHLANIHLFHYSDMKRDPEGSIRAMAGALEIAADDVTVGGIAKAVTFENMRANAGRFAPGGGTGVWKDDRRFFNKGKSAQWQNVLGETELALYRERMAELLPADAARWLERGSEMHAVERA